MTFVNVGTLGVLPEHRSALVEILIRESAELAAAGCLQYDVGVRDDEPGTVYVSERWDSADAHQASLQLASVQAAIEQARPMLTGDFGGWQFEVAGSPLPTG